MEMKKIKSERLSVLELNEAVEDEREMKIAREQMCMEDPQYGQWLEMWGKLRKETRDKLSSCKYKDWLGFQRHVRTIKQKLLGK
jgi:hypothetical protein